MAGFLWGLALIVGAAFYLSGPARERRRHVRAQEARQREWHAWLGQQPDALLATAEDPGYLLRQVMDRFRGGAFLGLGIPDREWVTADPEHAILVLGPPRSGKTSAIVVPAVLAAPGPVVSTSTKLDVFQATAHARSRWGRIWVFDPTGREQLPPGALRLSWSPVAVIGSWDDALSRARAMVDACASVRGSDTEFWNERAGAMLGALLHAATVSGRGIADVRSWVLREDLTHPQAVLLAHGEHLPADVLEGLARAPERTVSSICATASSVLSVYNSASALDASTHPNFDPAHFVRSVDTVYIVAPSIQQDRLAPLVVGLLEDIRQAAYAYRRALPIGMASRPVFWALDEAANIAPIHSLPSIVSEGGGQGVQVLACFQDLSQARARWGEAARGFLSLFGSKIVLPGIGDYGTLHDLSAMVGTWDRPYVSTTETWSRSQSRGTAAHSTYGSAVGGSVTGSTQREAILSEGEISNIPMGNALFLVRGGWRLLQLEPYFASRCWLNVLARAPSVILSTDHSR